MLDKKARGKPQVYKANGEGGEEMVENKYISMAEQVGISGVNRNVANTKRQ